jgi:hypothetical protein
MYNSYGECHHPVFDVPLKRLWKVFPKWQAGELTATDSYLYYIALLKATELVEFRAPCRIAKDTDRIVSSNLENLFHTIGKITSIKHPAFVVPTIAITHDTSDLQNSPHWIAIWNECFNDFQNGLKDTELRSKLQRKAAGLEILIKNPSLKPYRYAPRLAEWAAEAAEFPTFAIYNPVLKTNTSLSEYWQYIIVSCHTDSGIIAIPEPDITELLEHLETNLDAGSIQAHQLFCTVREGLDTIKGFFSIGSPTFSILSDNSNETVGASNLALMLSDAPLEKPRRMDYPSAFRFLQAELKYKTALAIRTDSAIADASLAATAATAATNGELPL